MAMDLPMLNESPNMACGVDDLDFFQQGCSCWFDCYSWWWVVLSKGQSVLWDWLFLQDQGPYSRKVLS